MGIFERFPHSEWQNMNLDSILWKIKELEGRIDGLVEEAVRQSNAYTDSKLAGMQAEINSFRAEIDSKFNALDRQYASFKRYVDARLDLMDLKLADFKAYIDQSIENSNDRTDHAIVIALEKFKKDLYLDVLDNAKVVNFFTGDRVTIQAMFDYLAALHIENGLTYDGIRDKNKTYTAMGDLLLTYTQVIINGDILIPA